MQPVPRRATGVLRRYAAAAGREVRAIAAERRAALPLRGSHRCTGLRTDPLVALTSYPPRMGRVHLTLRSLLRQSRPPGTVVLVLAEEEFPGRALPRKIRRLASRGVEVRWTADNLRSFKKLVPLLHELSERVVVTVDDDVVYPHAWLEELWAAHLRAPTTVWGTRGREIVVRDGRLQPYGTWPFAGPSTSSDLTLLTGMGGILYPPGSLPTETSDVGAAMRLCPRADDVWFKACAAAAGTEVRQVGSEPLDLPTRWRGQRSGLTATNLHGGENDRQLRETLAHFGLLERWGIRYS
ncbi:hypothetical protein [Nocardioides marmoraquaticus]